MKSRRDMGDQEFTPYKHGDELKRTYEDSKAGNLRRLGDNFPDGSRIRLPLGLSLFLKENRLHRTQNIRHEHLTDCDQRYYMIFAAQS